MIAQINKKQQLQDIASDIEILHIQLESLNIILEDTDTKEYAQINSLLFPIEKRLKEISYSLNSLIEIGGLKND